MAGSLEGGSLNNVEVSGGRRITSGEIMIRFNNVTKVSGTHTLKAGVYYQRASNRSNSQTNVEANIDFTSTASNPAPTSSASPF